MSVGYFLFSLEVSKKSVIIILVSNLESSVYMTQYENIKNFLSQKALQFHIEVHKNVSSTNDIAKEYAKNNRDGQAIIIASSQSAGRGRRGRSFFSPDGTGIYMSILLRPDHTPKISTLMTPAAAVAVAESIEKHSQKQPFIWCLNDIFIDGKKVCGILCESSLKVDAPELDYIIVGIGINISDPENGFPPEISDIAASVFGRKKLDEDTVLRMCADIIDRVIKYSEELEKRRFLSDYRKRSFVLGKEITVISPTEKYTATATDIDEDAHLLITLPDGSQQTLSSGEISIRPIKQKFS